MLPLSENLKKAIEERQTTISELSFDSRVTYPRIASILSGKTKNPRVETITKLADALGVTVDELIRDPGERESS